MDTPFDELYHKERKLVQDIVRAEKALKDIEAGQPNPASPMFYDPREIIDDHESYGNAYTDGKDSQFIRDKRRQAQEQR